MFRRISTLTLLAALWAATSLDPAAARADMLNPTVSGGAFDSNEDGLGDGVTLEFIGRDNRSPQTVFVAITEFDFDGRSSASFDSARLSGTIVANNSLPTGDRLIDVLIFGGDGALTASDFQVSASFVTTINFAFSTTTSTDFDIDITTQVKSLIDGGARYVGFRWFPNNDPSPPSTFGDGPRITLNSAIPEPASVGLLGLGAAGLVVRGRRRTRA